MRVHECDAAMAARQEHLGHVVACAEVIKDYLRAFSFVTGYIDGDERNLRLFLCKIVRGQIHPASCNRINYDSLAPGLRVLFNKLALAKQTVFRASQKDLEPHLPGAFFYPLADRDNNVRP